MQIHKYTNTCTMRSQLSADKTFIGKLMNQKNSQFLKFHDFNFRWKTPIHSFLQCTISQLCNISNLLMSNIIQVFKFMKEKTFTQLSKEQNKNQFSTYLVQAEKKERPILVLPIFRLRIYPDDRLNPELSSMSNLCQLSGTLLGP